ncbi:hypothetical protein OAH83_02050 [Methylophilaceae bacterium]|nr:hypothetical protein [Methylophilaceae bacterium]
MKKLNLYEHSGRWQPIVNIFALSSSRVFFLAFAVSLTAGFFVQLLLLPALPDLHAGNGLLKGLDSVWFHHEAIKLVALLRDQGWSAWELRPQGNAPIGITAALYFITGISEPWVLLFINAPLLALSAVALYRIFMAISPIRTLAFMAILPFILFPSAAMIYGQIHKDVFSIAGVLLITATWVRFSQQAQLSWRSLLGTVLFTATGCLLVWIVRPYLLQALMVTSLLAALLLVSVTGRGRGAAWWACILLCLLVHLGYMYMPTAPTAPTYLERAVLNLNVMRVGFATSSPNTGSNIDLEVTFDSLADVLLYVPRAFKTGLLAPFPSMWLSEGASPGSRIMRLIAGLEMMVSYILLIGVVILLYGLKSSRPALLVSILISITMTVILVLVVCNVGTLYRMRYGNWQLLNGFGVLGWVLWWQNKLAIRSGV